MTGARGVLPPHTHSILPELTGSHRMNLQLYNSLTNQMESFESLEPGVVRMYSCGPTVYDFAHIGNFRSFLFGDLGL